MVKTVFESDALFKNYREKWKKLDWCICVSVCQPVSSVVTWNIDRFLCDNTLILIHTTTRFSVQSNMRFYASN